jgi:hypothetical protein
MKKLIIVSIVVLVLSILTACTKLIEDPNYNNPNDPTGSNYFPPKITSILSDDSTLSINDPVTFTATAIDSSPDGIIVNFIWSKDGEVYGDTTADSVSFVTNFIEDTIHTIWVKAIDNEGVVSPLADSINITVISVAPIATIALPTTETVPVIVGQSLSFSANWSDIDGTSRGNFAWYLDTTLINSLIDSIATIKFVELGTKTVSVSVTDEDGLVSLKDNITVIVEAVRPVITSLTDTVLVYADSSFELKATAEYEAAKITHFYWQCAELAIDITTAGTLIVSASVDNTYKIAVRAVAEDGYESYIDTVYFTVAVPGKPRVTPLEGFEVIQGSSHDITVGYADDNGEIEQFYWGRDSSSLIDSTTTATKEFTFNSEGEDTIWVMVKDNDGQFSNKEFVVVTVISLDVPSVFGMSDTAITLGNPITLTANSVTAANYLWAVDGVNFDSSSATGSLTHTFATHGDKIVLIKAKDVDGNSSAVDTIVVSVIHTNAPTISGGSSVSAEVNTPVALGVTGVAGGALVGYVVTNNGVKDTISAAGEHTFLEVGTFNIKVQALDNIGFLSAPLAIVATVSSAKPTLTVVKDKDTVYINTDITFTASADDADGTVTTYYWSVDSSKTWIIRNNDSTFTTQFNSWGGPHTILVKCTDNSGAPSNIDTIDVWVTGTAPTASGLSISMNATGDSLIGNYTFNDVDASENDNGTTFSWSVAGSSLNINSNKIHKSLVNEGDKVWFEVSPVSSGFPENGAAVACSSTLSINHLNHRTVGSAGSDSAAAVVATGDGYIIAGTTEWGEGNTEVYAVKIDEAGEKVWEKSYGGTGASACNSITKMSDGNYALGGKTWNSSTGRFEALLIKITASGTILWEKTYTSNSENDYIINSIMANGDGLIAVGYGIADQEQNSTMWYTLLVNNSGDQRLALPNYEVDYSSFTSIVAIDDGYNTGYYFAGYWGNITNTAPSFLVSYNEGVADHPLKSDKVITKHNNSAGLREYCNDIIDDNGYIAVGNSGQNIRVGSLQLYSQTGQLYPSGLLSYASGSQEGNSIISDTSGGYLIAGKREMGTGAPTDGLILNVKISEDYYIEEDDAGEHWSGGVTVGGTGNEELTDIIPSNSNDGEYIAVGSTDSYGVGSKDFYIIRINEEGSLVFDPDQIIITPIN